MNKKISVFVVAVLFISGTFFAKSDGTLIGQFKLDARDLLGVKKQIVNNSKYHLIFRYTLKDPRTGQEFSQEPLIQRAEQKTIDFDHAARHFSPDAHLDCHLTLLRVKQLAKGPGQPLVAGKLKDGALALQLHKKKFLENQIFEFSMNKNGLLMSKALKG